MSRERKRRPWIRLYREESGSFAQLSFYARAVAKQLLTLTDDEGFIEIGSRSPEQAIAFVAGATQSDRRLLRGHIAELVADGFLDVLPGRLRVRNFVARQSDEPASSRTRVDNERNAKPPRVGADSDASRERVEREPDATRARVERENIANPAKPGAARSVLSSEREEEEREVDQSASARTTTTSDPWIVVGGIYSRHYEPQLGAWMSLHANHRELDQLALWASAQAAQSGTTFEAVVNKLFAIYFAVPSARKEGFPLSWVAKNPGKYFFADRLAVVAPPAVAAPPEQAEMRLLEAQLDEARQTQDYETVERVNARINELVTAARRRLRGLPSEAAAE